MSAGDPDATSAMSMVIDLPTHAAIANAVPASGRIVSSAMRAAPSSASTRISPTMRADWSTPLMVTIAAQTPAAAPLPLVPE